MKVGLGRKQALPDELERKLAEYCIEMEKSIMGFEDEI